MAKHQLQLLPLVDQDGKLVYPLTAPHILSCPDTLIAFCGNVAEC